MTGKKTMRILEKNWMKNKNIQVFGSILLSLTETLRSRVNPSTFDKKISHNQFKEKKTHQICMKNKNAMCIPNMWNFGIGHLEDPFWK